MWIPVPILDHLQFFRLIPFCVFANTNYTHRAVLMSANWSEASQDRLSDIYRDDNFDIGGDLKIIEKVKNPSLFSEKILNFYKSDRIIFCSLPFQHFGKNWKKIFFLEIMRSSSQLLFWFSYWVNQFQNVIHQKLNHSIK